MLDDTTRRRLATSGRIALALLLATAGSVASARAAKPAEEQPGQRPCERAKPDERFRVDLRDAPLADFARLVSCAADMNLLFVPSSLAQKKITVISSRSVKLAALLELFHAALLQHDLMMERRGAYWAILKVPRR